MPAPDVGSGAVAVENRDRSRGVDPRPFRREFAAIGTVWQIDTDRELTPGEWATVDQRIADYDRTYSRFRADSVVARLTGGPTTLEFPPDVLPLIDLYRRLYEATDGAVTPLIGGTLADLGYDADYTFRPRPVPRRTPDWDEVMTWDGPVVTTRAPLVLDVGAAGKGHLVDLVGGLLTSFGVASWVVDGSGDLRHRPPADHPGDTLRVGLEHPFVPGQVIGVTPLSDDALAASAGNRRTWTVAPDRSKDPADGAPRRLHHIIDPRTGRPTGDVLATWVIAENALVADGLATALFFTDPPRTHDLAAALGADWVRVAADGSATWSPTFEGELFR